MPRRPDQKEWIIKRAVALWAKKGYSETGVDELCRATGLGKGALYYHIGSKEQLLYEISTRHTLEDIAYANEVLSRDVSASDKLRLLSRGLMRSIQENLDEWRIVFREINTLKGAKGSELRARRDRYEQQWRQVIEEGTSSGEFKPTNPVLLKGILGMHNYSYLWLRGRGEMAADDIADVYCDALLGGLRWEPSKRASVRTRAAS